MPAPSSRTPRLPRLAPLTLALSCALVLSACGGGGGSKGGVRPAPDDGLPTTTTPAPGDEGPAPAVPAPQEPAPDEEEDTLTPTEPSEPPGPGPETPPGQTPEPPPTAAPLSAESFETPEYHGGRFLSAINASVAYAAGSDGVALSGAGVVAAVIDTGFDTQHPDFAGRVESGRIFYGYGASDTAVSDLYGHGTHVAGILGAARNEGPMHGVAPGVSLLPVVLAPVPLFESDYAQAFRFALDAGARIYNNSWVMNINLDSFADKHAVEAAFPQMSATFKDIADSGGVVVFATGNDGASNASFWARVPEKLDYLRQNWVAVTAIGSDGRLTGYANACGTTGSAAWCIAAPGGDGVSSILSTMPEGTYGYSVGTSMAAPVVSGAIALLMEKFPTLSGEDIVARIFHTANKTGEYAQSHLYGQGLLDVGAAASPVEGLYVPVGSSVTGPVVPLSQVALSTDPTAAKALSAALAGTSLLAVDGFQRAPFLLEASQLIQGQAGKPDSVADKLARSSHSGTVGEDTAGAAYAGFYNGAGSLMKLAGTGGSRMVLSANMPFSLARQAASTHLPLAPLGLREQMTGERHLGYAHQGMGAGWGLNLANGWQAGVYSHAAHNGSGRTEQALALSVQKAWDTVATSFSLSQRAGSLDAQGFGASASARPDNRQSMLEAQLVWQPEQAWEVVGGLQLARTERQMSGAGTQLNMSGTTQRIFFGGSHQLNGSDWVLGALAAWQPASTRSVQLDMPTGVRPDGTVLRHSVVVKVRDASQQSYGLYLEHRPAYPTSAKLSASLTHNGAGGTEALFAVRKPF